MELEELRKIAQEEIKKQIIENLDSSLVFTYIQNLENENKKLQDKLKESIPRAVMEEKIKELDYSYKNIEKNYTEEQLDNYDVSEEDYIEMEKREFAEMILQKILNKGE